MSTPPRHLVRAELVQRCDGPRYRIHCPYCGGTHHHGAEDGLRLSHCARRRGGEYYLVGSDIYDSLVLEDVSARTSPDDLGLPEQL